MTVMVKKVGGSVSVLIPKALALEMGLSDGTSLEVTCNDDAIVMRKRGRRPRRSLKSLVTRIQPASYRRRNREQNEVGPIGKEWW
jgi:antitoxin component of MazEF toxin-antitoxin module